MTLKAAGRIDFRRAGLAARLGLCLAAVGGVLLLSAAHAAETTARPATQTALKQRTFDTPEAAVAALVSAAGRFDVTALKEILGPDGVDLVVSSDPVLDRH
jgi:hypothetical protein